MEAEKQTNAQHSNDPGQGTAGVQASRGHNDRISEWLTHSNVPTKGVKDIKTILRF